MAQVWSTGLFGCFSSINDCAFCFMAIPCGCVAYGMNSALIMGHKDCSNCISWDDCVDYTCYNCIVCCDQNDSVSSNADVNNLAGAIKLCCCPFLCLKAELTNNQVQYVGEKRLIYNPKVTTHCCITDTYWPSMFCWPCVLTRVHRELIEHPEIKATHINFGEYTKNSMFDNIKLI
jgi:hypothetical protein